MSVATYNHRMTEFAGVKPPPNFVQICNRLDRSVQNLLPGQWVHIYDYEYPDALLYVVYGWAELIDIEFSDDMLRFRKPRRTPYQKMEDSNNEN